MQTGRLAGVLRHRHRQKIIGCAFLPEGKHTLRGAREHRLVEHQREPLEESVRRPAAPVGPLVLTRAEAVVDRAVREKELKVIEQPRLIESELSAVFCENRVAQQQRERFLEVIAHVDAAAAAL